MKNIFFTSDTHFGHRNIITYCRRPFDSVEQMNETMVERWNAKVKPEDTVYFLGDWAFNDYHYIGRLQGTIISIPGNHDLGRTKKLEPYLSGGFSPEIVYLKVDNVYRFTLCHYPFEAWRREYKYHLHGHTHGTGGPGINRLDIGVDVTTDYAPLHLDEVITALSHRT